MQFGASPDFLAGTETGWVGFEVVLALLLALAAGAALRLATSGDPPAHGGWMLSGALGLTVLLSGGVAKMAAVTGGLPLWGAAGAALWSVPAGLAALALTRWDGWRRELIGWTVAVVLGTSAALPFAWSGRIVSRMTVAERQLERLGDQVDPYLQFLLGRFGEMADSLDERSGPAEGPLSRLGGERARQRGLSGVAHVLVRRRFAPKKNYAWEWGRYVQRWPTTS